MTPPKRLLDMVAPPGTSGAAPSPVGTDAIGTSALEAAAPESRPAPGPEGEQESQNAIMQALAGGHQQPGAMGGQEQIPPSLEEAIKMKLALAARERLIGGAGG